MITSAHRVEVEVGADGRASAPLCGAAAVTPPAGASILPNEEPVDDVVRELLEEDGLTLSLDDLTLLSDAPVHVALHEGQRHLVSVFSASFPIPCVTANLRTHAKLEHVVTAQSTINLDGSYVVPTTIDIDGLSLTLAKQGLLTTLRRQFELLHFGYVTQWETFRRAVDAQHVLRHEDTSLPRQFLFNSRFTYVDTGHVWMLITCYINQLCG
jgi:ADP-ribose pyrophosphatase YjhB (NUDIX family)